MEKIPGEMLDYIMQFLPIKDQRNVRRSNKNLYEILSDEYYFKQIPPEIFNMIIDYLPAKDLGNLRATNLYLSNSIPKYDVYVKNDREIKTKISDRIDELKKFNPLWTLINMFPNWNWDWDEVSANINTYWDTEGVLNPKYWSYWGLSSNPNITLDIILSDPAGQWDWSEITGNPSITNLDRLTHPDLPWVRGIDNLLWNEYKLTKQKQAEAEEMFLDHIEYWINENAGDTMMIDYLPHAIIKSPHLMYLIDKYTQRNTNGNIIPVNYKGKQIRIDWNANSYDNDISGNKYFTWDFINRHRDHILFDTNLISSNKNITLDIMINNPQIGWKFYRNPNLTVDYILGNLDLGWEDVADILSKNPLGTT